MSLRDFLTMLYSTDPVFLECNAWRYPRRAYNAMDALQFLDEDALGAPLKGARHVCLDPEPFWFVEVEGV